MLPEIVLTADSMVSGVVLTMPGLGVLSSKSNCVCIILGPSSRHCKILVPNVFIAGDKKSVTSPANQSNNPISIKIHIVIKEMIFIYSCIIKNSVAKMAQKLNLPLSIVLASLFKTIVKGACVLEKKHIAIGPNNG